MARVLLYFILIVSIPAMGQSESQILSGKILADSLQGYAINIINYTKKIGVTNDENGVFQIPVALGDSIVFSSVQYNALSINVSQTHLAKKEIIVILEPKVQLLDQVQVSNIELSGNLNKDLNTVALQPFVDNRTLGLPFSDQPQPTLIQRRIYTARSGILELPINYLNGKLKKLKRIQALEEIDLIVQKGEETFANSFFLNELELPENLISDFMYYCAEDEYFKNLLENSKRLSLIEFFKRKVVLYKRYKEREEE